MLHTDRSSIMYEMHKMRRISWGANVNCVGGIIVYCLHIQNPKSVLTLTSVLSIHEWIFSLPLFLQSRPESPRPHVIQYLNPCHHYVQSVEASTSIILSHRISKSKLQKAWKEKILLKNSFGDSQSKLDWDFTSFELSWKLEEEGMMWNFELMWHTNELTM